MNVSLRVRPFNARELRHFSADTSSTSGNSLSDQLLRSCIRVSNLNQSNPVVTIQEFTATKQSADTATTATTHDKNLYSLQEEKQSSQPIEFEESLIVERRDVECFHHFDNVFWDVPFEQVARFDDEQPSSPMQQQREIYKRIGAPAVDLLFSGKNAVVMGYGVTFSGKHHSIFSTDPRSEGIAALALRDCFDRMKEEETLAARMRSEKTVSSMSSRINDDDHDEQSIKDEEGNVSSVVANSPTPHLQIMMYQIYHEKIADLLPKRDRDDDQKQLKSVGTFDEQSVRIRERPRLDKPDTSGSDPTATTSTFAEHIYLEGITAVSPASIDEAIKLISAGVSRRLVMATHMGQTTSRLGLILEIHLHREGRKSSVLKFVTAPGSERAMKSGASGSLLKEAALISKSLTTFRSCVVAAVRRSELIAAAAAQKNNQEKIIHHHVPVRDSVLTRIIQQVFSGESKLFFLATVGPSPSQMAETVMTLRLSQHVKKMSCQPTF